MLEVQRMEHAMTISSPLPTDEDREALVDIEITHRPTSWNGGSGCTCGATNPGMTMHLQQWHRVHLVDAVLGAGFRRSVVSPPSDDVQALIDDDGWPGPAVTKVVMARWSNDNDTIRRNAGGWGWYGLAQSAIQALAQAGLLAVSAPPTITDEPVAWAIRGRKTGRIREVTTDEELADECREHYDVIPLVAAPSRDEPTFEEFAEQNADWHANQEPEER